MSNNIRPVVVGCPVKNIILGKDCELKLSCYKTPKGNPKVGFYICLGKSWKNGKSYSKEMFISPEQALIVAPSKAELVAKYVQRGIEILSQNCGVKGDKKSGVAKIVDLEGNRDNGSVAGTTKPNPEPTLVEVNLDDQVRSSRTAERVALVEMVKADSIFGDLEGFNSNEESWM